MANIKPAVIGGSGLEKLNLFQNWREEKIITPYGDTSSTMLTGLLGDMEVVILSRHGRQHTITPSQINNRANLWALKEVGCTHILASAACGSLREHIRMGHLVFPDQFIDFTRHRVSTFVERFDPELPNHASMPDPFDPAVRQVMVSAARQLDLPHHTRGTIITIEGPRFSTRAESRMFQSWGADIINMTIAPEAILANELQIPYGVVAIATDYDAWHLDETTANWEDILRVFSENVVHVTNLLVKVLEQLGQNSNSARK